MKLTKSILSVGLTCFVSSMATATEVPYPENYRDWSHVKTMLIDANHPLANPFEGIHHIYANNAAKKGLQQGQFGDGAVLVFDLLKTIDKDHTVQEGDRKLIGVMRKDAQKYANTGGWGFEAFAGNSQSERIVTDGGQSCFGCHTSQRDSSYVFSKLR